MDPTPPPGRAIDSPLTAPESLLDSDGIHTTRVIREQDESHFETRDSLAGFVIVGITNEAGDVLLTSTSDGRFWRLPYGEVEPETDYFDGATNVLNAVQQATGVEASVERIVDVRRFDAVLEDTPAAEVVARASDPDRDALSALDGHSVSHDVIVEARSTGGGSLSGMADDDVTVDWFAETPDGAPGGVPGDDLALFID